MAMTGRVWGGAGVCTCGISPWPSAGQTWRCGSPSLHGAPRERSGWRAREERGHYSQLYTNALSISGYTVFS